MTAAAGSADAAHTSKASSRKCWLSKTQPSSFCLEMWRMEAGGFCLTGEREQVVKSSWRKTFNTSGLRTLKNKVWREGFVLNPVLILPRQAVWQTNNAAIPTGTRPRWLRASPHLTIEASTGWGQFVADLMAHSGVVMLGPEWQNCPFCFPV